VSIVRHLPVEPRERPSEDAVVRAAVPDYARTLRRLTADFSAAAAFLLSDPVFERLGCNGRVFVDAARQAYADSGLVSPVEVRRRAQRLLAESDLVLATLKAAAQHHQATLDTQRRTGEALADMSRRISSEVSDLLAEKLGAATDAAIATGVDDPERIAAALSEIAAEVFAHAKQAWAPVFADLANISPPPSPMMFSGRQLYIETVKLFNQHRLRTADSAAADAWGLRGLFGKDRRPARHAADARQDRIPQIIQGIGQAVSAAVLAWHRSAYERVQRKGLEGGSGVGEAGLAQELALIRRSSAQLAALKRELLRGMSVRHYYLALLRQASGCSRSA
jgi:hypothetical protein